MSPRLLFGIPLSSCEYVCRCFGCVPVSWGRGVLTPDTMLAFVAVDRAKAVVPIACSVGNIGNSSLLLRAVVNVFSLIFLHCVGEVLLTL